MEEHPRLPAELALSSDESSSTLQNTHLSGTAQTVTMPPSHHPVGTEPQFLHGSGWPHENAVDQVVGTTIQPLHSDSPAAGLVLFETSDCEPVSWPMPDSASTDTWRTVTPDQISMALDYWDPDDGGWPYPAATTVSASDLTHTVPIRDPRMINRQSLFLREIMDEYLTRIQTAEHIKELEDNDNAIDIVSALEQYRQNGWAEEMIRAFPAECRLFWSNSGLDASMRRDGGFGLEGFDCVVNGNSSEAQ